MKRNDDNPNVQSSMSNVQSPISDGQSSNSVDGPHAHPAAAHPAIHACASASHFDRLVDGDLPECERRDLLLALDTTPDGWKQCALAFLEAQAWRQAMTATPARTATQITQHRERETASMSAPGPWRLTRSRLMLAATVALVFGIGAAIGMSLRPAPITSGALVKNPEVQPVPGGQGDQPRIDRASDTPAPRPAIDPARSVTVALLPADSPQGHAVSADAPQVPPYVLAQLQRQGYELTRDRKLVSVALDDGRKVTIPIDTIRWQYVGQSTH